MKLVLPLKEKPPIECMVEEASASGLTVRGNCFRLYPVFFCVLNLLLIFLLGFVFLAMGNNVWRLLVSWDDETMRMRISTQGKITWHDYENSWEPAFDDAFFQKLEELEITPLLPTWMPDGFALEKVESKIVTEYLRYAAGIYTCGERNLIIRVFKNTSKNPVSNLSIEKDERKPDIFEQGGIRFYIMDNLSVAVACWYDLPYRVEITGCVTRAEIRQMINSMFERK